MHVGFIHGVMNTDNMAVSGETIDFGPCAFMDTFDPATVFSSIDERGRYAYGNQPNAAPWNLARFAETLLPLIDADPQRAIAAGTRSRCDFRSTFKDGWLDGLRRKLGLSLHEDGDAALAEDLLRGHAAQSGRFHSDFRALCDAADNEAGDQEVRRLFVTARDYDEWAQRWRARLARETVAPALRAEAMRQVNPAYIPRNHRIEQNCRGGRTR